MESTIICMCPNCNKQFELDESFLGAKGECDACEAKFIIEGATLSSGVASQLSEPQPSVVPQNSASPTAVSAHGYKPAKKSKLPLVGTLALLLAGAGYIGYTQYKKSAEEKEGLVAAKEADVSEGVDESESGAVSGKAASDGFSTMGDAGARKLSSSDPHPLIAELESQSLQSLYEELDSRLSIKARGGDFSAEVRRVLGERSYQRDLALFTLMQKCGVEFFEDLAKQSDGKDFVKNILGDTAWQEEIMASGPFRHPKLTVRYLYLIWKHGGEHFHTPLYQQLATCVALEHAERQAERGSITDYHVVRRYLDYVKAHQELELHADFDGLEAWEMRLAIEIDRDERHFAYHSKRYHYQTQSYMSTCWDSPYHRNTVFGDSIHGAEYYKPWEHAYCWPEMAVKVGGVCGTLSHHGASAARVKGIPAMAAGQPSHCAYIIRANNDWVVTYNVTWPTGPKNSFWGWTYTHLSLIEDAFKDSSSILASCRAAWLGDRYIKHIRFTPRQCKVYQSDNWKSVPDFSKITPTKVLDVNDLSYRKHSGKRDWLAVSYSGEIKVPARGEYNIYIKADDEARLRLEGHPELRASAGTNYKGTLLLSKGAHPFNLDYVEAAGGDSLSVKLESKQVDRRVLACYDIATDIAPLNYGVWVDFRNHLLKSEAKSSMTKAFCFKAAKALEQHQEAAWQLLSSHGLFEDLSPKNKFTRLLKLHHVLQQRKVKKFIDYPYASVLKNQQSILDNDKSISFAFFKKILRFHEKSERYFVRTLNWGQGNFAKDQKFKTKFNDYIAELAANGGSGDRFIQIFKQNILEAVNSGNKENFHKFSKLASKVIKKEGDEPSWPYNEIDPYPGYLLSGKGVLRLSTTSEWDNILGYRDVIANTKRGGEFHTDHENQPFAEVLLEGKGRLSGITVINSKNQSHRQLPLSVQVSQDGEKWQTVFETTKNAPYWNIDLKENNIIATHVRAMVSRPNGKKDYFHLRGILVYGKKLF